MTMKIVPLLSKKPEQQNPECSKPETWVSETKIEEKPDRLSRSTTMSECGDILEWNEESELMTKKINATSRKNNLAKLFVPFFLVHKNRCDGHAGSPRAKYSPRASRYSQSPWAPGGKLGHPSSYLLPTKLSVPNPSPSVVQDVGYPSILGIFAFYRLNKTLKKGSSSDEHQFKRRKEFTNDDIEYFEDDFTMFVCQNGTRGMKCQSSKIRNIFARIISKF